MEHPKSRDKVGTKLGESIVLTDEIRTRYGITETWRFEAHMAAAFLSLKAGLSSYITVHGGEYDTHTNHLATHVPTMQKFASGLASFVEDLSTTQDPTAAAGTMLSDTTTILISSEFCRTPKFNIAAGTDHWQSASAILMGKDIKDNTVIGATDDSAMPMGWLAGELVPRTAESELNASLVYGGLVKYLGYSNVAETISPNAFNTSFMAQMFSVV